MRRPIDKGAVDSSGRATVGRCHTQSDIMKWRAKTRQSRRKNSDQISECNHNISWDGYIWELPSHMLSGRRHMLEKGCEERLSKMNIAGENFKKKKW